ncbi:putative MRPL31-mitochondrial ribosomal protein, large subunit [Conidiobolus coronatus NRRL 28638]|uniref:Putative MRPL31-mitochondrial ribosomal protein, large subunit n=1 Tax=Conidiobolus coronatus (strain ATCC 28846 / CBS 209.66 / NRRL 28638) TaxID=796925 RepID=A0A137NZ29_CONC2|nr:putative MRPL31-mitochondrial ribosomal protein, large subunit [Conidiobolus coronatus NRRL 28638]|eukprot:KXN68090.1 putative MRPL31-mitochondrial ribosomal protein, large subunit [Conidiobolus coronatus NRRL 28638]
MLGPFRASLTALGGLVWKNPWKMSSCRKANLRKRLRDVDEVVKTLSDSGYTCKRLEEFKKLPTEAELSPREKYTVFSKSTKGHRLVIHKVPKFTKLPHPRKSPIGF